MSIRRGDLRKAALAGVVGLLAACAPMERSHGYLPEQADLDGLIVGVDTQGIVEETIGRPQDVGLSDGQTWYYVENVASTLAFFPPKVTQRTVLALDFDADGVLSGITRYGLEDGQVVNLVTRVTPTDRRRRSVLNQIFGNVGARPLPPIPG